MIEILWTGSECSRKWPTIAWPISWYAVIRRSFSPMTRVFFSGPATTRMMPSSSSVCVISFLPVRAARSAASLTRFARSAPVKPGVWPASASTLDVLGQRLAARVDLEDLRAALAVRAVHGDLTVEAAGAQQGGVEDVGPVGGRDHDDVVLGLEAVHLHQELVQRLLALVVTAAHAGATMAADGVDLVHEDDAGRVLLGLLEEVAHAGGADADEHLDEVRAGDREERHARLTRDGTREERLAGARRPVEQHALRDPGAERLELLRVLEELLDLVQLLDGLVRAGDVAEGDLRRVHAHALGARLAEGHDLRAAALDLVHQEDPEADEDQDREDVRQQREQDVRARGLDVEAVDLAVRLRLAQLVDQRRAGFALHPAGRVLLRVGALEGHLGRVVLRAQRDGLDRAVVDLREELAVGRCVAPRYRSG